MVLLEFSMSPLGKGESVGKYVARSVETIEASGLPYRLNPMGTVLEGSWEECFDVVRRCFERMRKDCNRISCVIKVDYRKGHTNRLVSKTASVERRLRKKLKMASGGARAFTSGGAVGRRRRAQGSTERTGR